MIAPKPLRPPALLFPSASGCAAAAGSVCQTRAAMSSGSGSDPTEFLGLVGAAEMKSAGRDWAAAGELWTRVVVQNPLNGNHWDRLAEALYESGDFAGANRAYEQVQQLGVSCRFGVRESTLPGEVAYRLACRHASMGNDEGAVGGLAAALCDGFRDLQRRRCGTGLKCGVTAPARGTAYETLSRRGEAIRDVILGRKVDCQRHEHVRRYQTNDHVNV